MASPRGPKTRHLCRASLWTYPFNVVLDVVVAVVVVAVLVVEVAGALRSSHVAAGRQRHDDDSSNEQSLVKCWPFLALPG